MTLNVFVIVLKVHVVTEIVHYFFLKYRRQCRYDTIIKLGTPDHYRTLRFASELLLDEAN